MHAYGMASVRSTPMIWLPMRWLPMRWPPRMAPVRSMSERRAYERHTYEMVYRRCTPIKCPSIGEVCLRDTFNQSIQIAFTIRDPQMASLLVVINEMSLQLAMHFTMVGCEAWLSPKLLRGQLIWRWTFLQMVSPIRRPLSKDKLCKFIHGGLTGTISFI
jgi:hypothetical protein